MNASLDTVNAFLKLTNSADADIAGASVLLADDVQFIGPAFTTTRGNSLPHSISRAEETHT